MDGNSSVGSALTPTNNWMGTNSGVEPIILPSFSDSNFDFTAAGTLSFAHTGTLTASFYTGGAVGYQFDTLTITGNISAVPEPSSNILFLVGLALGLRRRRS